MRKPKKQRPPVENRPSDALPAETVLEKPDDEKPDTQPEVKTVSEEPVAEQAVVEQPVVEEIPCEKTLDAEAVAVPLVDESATQALPEQTLPEQALPEEPATSAPEAILTEAVEPEEAVTETPAPETAMPEAVMETITADEPASEGVKTEDVRHAVELPETEALPEVMAAESVAQEAVPDVIEKDVHENEAVVEKDVRKEAVPNADEANDDVHIPVTAGATSTTVSTAVVASSAASKCFNALAWLGPLAALLILLAQTIPGINLRALWLPDETILPTLLDSMKLGADPFLLLLNGAPYPDLPPAYFWFLAGLDSLWQLTPLPYTMPLLLLGGSVAAGFLLLLVTWILARACGSDSREAFAACAVLLCTFVVCGLTRVATPDLLFAACVAASCLCLYSGWMQTKAPLTLLVGFLLAGLAMLIAGPVGLVLPLGASLIFLLWRGTFRRAGAMDGAFGFAVLLIAIGGWLAWLGLTYGRAPAEALLNHHIPQWSLTFWSDPQRWLCDAATLAVLLLPWPLVLFFLPWERLYRLPILLWRNRKENPGIGFVWCALLVSLIILSFTFSENTVGFAPLLPFLAVILGRTVLRLSPVRSKLFFGLVGLALFASAVILGLCSALPFLADWLPADLPLPEACADLATLPGTSFVAGAALLFSLILLKFTDKTFPGGGLLVLVLFATVAMLPVGVLTLPSLAPLNTVEDVPPVTPVAPVAPEAPVASTPAVEPVTPVAPVAPAVPETSEVPEAPAASPEVSTPTETPTTPTEVPTPAETPAAPAEVPTVPTETPAAS